MFSKLIIIQKYSICSLINLGLGKPFYADSLLNNKSANNKQVFFRHLFLCLLVRDEKKKFAHSGLHYSFHMRKKRQAAMAKMKKKRSNKVIRVTIRQHRIYSVSISNSRKSVFQQSLSENSLQTPVKNHSEIQSAYSSLYDKKDKNQVIVFISS